MIVAQFDRASGQAEIGLPVTRIRIAQAGIEPFRFDGALREHPEIGQMGEGAGIGIAQVSRQDGCGSGGVSLQQCMCAADQIAPDPLRRQPVERFGDALQCRGFAQGECGKRDRV